MTLQPEIKGFELESGYRTVELPSEKIQLRENLMWEKIERLEPIPLPPEPATK